MRVPNRRIYYLAGLFDGEGWVSFRAGKADVGLGNTNKALVKLFHRIFAGYWSTNRTKIGRVCYRWSIHNEKSIRYFHRLLGDKLVEKRGQLNLLIRYYDRKKTRKGKRLDIYGKRLRKSTSSRIRNLNRGRKL